MAEKRPIIIKKKKGGHAGAHGGSWKVAYADFVTAMMAFFLLLWLLSMVPKQSKDQLAQYFKEFNLFAPGGQAFEVGQFRGDMKIASDHGAPQPADLVRPEGVPANAGNQTTPGNATDVMKILNATSLKNLPLPIRGKDAAGGDEKAPREADPAVVLVTKEQLQTALAKVVEEKLAELNDQVVIDTFEDGVRIQLVDRLGRPLFDKGGVELSANGKRLLSVITESIKDLGNKIAVEGHTDSQPFPGSVYTNWELSTARASAARRVMETQGLDQKLITRVAGYASTVPLIRNDPADPKNRRISVLVFDAVRYRPPGAQGAAPPGFLAPSLNQGPTDKPLGTIRTPDKPGPQTLLDEKQGDLH